MTLTELFTSIADKIREWNEWAPEKIKALNFPSEIENACAESHYSGYSVGVQEGKESMIDRSKVIEKTASGNPVVITDASEVPHTVNIKVSNKKNLFDKNNIDFYNAYINVNRQLWGHSIDSSSVRVKCDANTTYTVSLSEPVAIFRIASIESDSRPLVSGDGIPMANYVSLPNTQITTTFTTSANAKYLVVQIPLETYERVINSLEIVTDKPVSGIKVTLLENGNSNTTDSNGECEFESLSPNMTFACDNAVNIDIDYWKSYGMQTEYDRFWDVLQKKGEKVVYEYRFFNFPAEIYNPKYDFIFDNYSAYSANSTFRTLQAPDILKNCDFTLMTAVGLYYTFYQSSALVNARTLKVNENVKYVNSFGGCTNLEEIRFEGSIGQNGLSFANSAKLSVKSLRSILTALSKNSTYASGKTITFNTASKAVIESDSECVSQLTSAVSAGWTIAYA